MSLVFILKDLNESVPKEVTRLEHMAQAPNTLLPVMTRIAEDMMRIERAVFSSQGRRGGGSWKPLKPDTIKRKGGSTQILVKTGELRASLTEPGATYQVLQVSDNRVLLGTDDPVAAHHHFGAPGAGVPARPLIKLLPGDEIRWNKMIAEHLVRAHRV